jgi:hypothetical protein
VLEGTYATKYKQSSEYVEGSTHDWGHIGGRLVEFGKFLLLEHELKQLDTMLIEVHTMMRLTIFGVV